MTTPGTWRGRATPLSGGGQASPLRLAVEDVVAGARFWPQWFTLGNLDIRLRFRRTGLGPLWTTLSFSILAVALGLVYGAVFGEPIADYLPYVVLGLFAWGFIATTLQEASDGFVHADWVLKQLYLPRTTLVYRTLWRNLVLLGFNLLAVAAVLAACAVPVGASSALALAGLALLCLNLFWVSLMLAIATARFRAVSRIVQSALPIGMLVTPVIWRPGSPDLRDIAGFNPFFHAVELVRGPMLGAPPPPATWLAAAAVALLGISAALLLLARTRARIPYWL
jgi:ABC-2 type transport system permease protein/lipopolysaccharide transport system permease protein